MKQIKTNTSLGTDQFHPSLIKLSIFDINTFIKNNINKNNNKKNSPTTHTPPVSSTSSSSSSPPLPPPPPLLLPL